MWSYDVNLIHLQRRSNNIVGGPDIYDISIEGHNMIIGTYNPESEIITFLQPIPRIFFKQLIDMLEEIHDADKADEHGPCKWSCPHKRCNFTGYTSDIISNTTDHGGKSEPITCCPKCKRKV